MARVSAIIIFLNEAQFLYDAIASVRGQTFEDWELILVDDGSTDKSPAIASRNRGLAEATGEYIAFLDGDDVWLPGKLADQVAILDAEPGCGMLYGRTLLWYGWDPGAGLADSLLELGVVPDRAYDPPVLYRLLLRNRAQTPTTANAIMRRALIDRVGSFEEEFRTLFEDQVFWVKAHLAGPCYVSGEVWARYRQHTRSSTAAVHPLQELAALAGFHRWVGRYIAANYPWRWELWSPLLAAQIDCRLRQARALASRSIGRG
jgi:glycosyltransferase involved in cell wall biosynthesis